MCRKHSIYKAFSLIIANSYTSNTTYYILHIINTQYIINNSIYLIKCI